MIPTSDEGKNLSDAASTAYVQINIDAALEAKINEIASQVQLSREEIIHKSLESGLKYLLERLRPKS